MDYPCFHFNEKGVLPYFSRPECSFDDTLTLLDKFRIVAYIGFMRSANVLDTWRKSRLPDALPDNDDGYDQVRLHFNDAVQLSKVTGAQVRAVYEGEVNMYGEQDDSMRLEGGTNDNKMYAVDVANRAIEYANGQVKIMSANEFQLVIVDVLRLSRRAVSGFDKTARQMLAIKGIEKPEPADLLINGREATRIFSHVRPQQNANYEALIQKLEKDTRLMTSLRQTVQVAKSDPGFPAAMKKALADYVTITANMGVGDAGASELDLTATHSMHGGGAAIDFFIADRYGKPLSIVPFDYPNAKFAAYRFTEEDSNYPALLTQIESDPMLREHFRKLGYEEPADFTRTEWEYYKQANRVQMQIMMVMGATTYADERWHFEVGNKVLGLDGQPIANDTTADTFPNCGGTGYTVIKHGKAAVFNTASSEAFLRKQGLLSE
jgi:D-alanyl-D-alanine dipeptidase